MFRNREWKKTETATANRVNSAESDKLQQTNFSSVLYGIVSPAYFNTITCLLQVYLFYSLN